MKNSSAMRIVRQVTLGQRIDTANQTTEVAEIDKETGSIEFGLTHFHRKSLPQNELQGTIYFCLVIPGRGIIVWVG